MKGTSEGCLKAVSHVANMVVQLASLHYQPAGPCSRSHCVSLILADTLRHVKKPAHAADRNVFRSFYKDLSRIEFMNIVCIHVGEASPMLSCRPLPLGQKPIISYWLVKGTIGM